MVGVLIVSHGAIGRSLLESARHILGEAPALVATLGVSRDDDPDDLRLRARRLIKQLDAGNGVLVLTDIFGATPGNVIARLLEDGRVEGVSGLSLPMLLRVLTSRNAAPHLDLGAVVERAMSGGAEGVVHMNVDRCCDGQ
jgi:PTS system ascorbate-specific IIA component